MNRSTCPATLVFNLLSKRWMLLILHNLSNGISSFNSMRRALKGMSSRTLSERFKELESFGFVERKVLSLQPLKVEYSLTAKAKSFEEILHNISDWAKKEI